MDKIKKERNSNLELFRIITMIMIVFAHYVANSGVAEIVISENLSVKSLFALAVSAFGKTGINCFVLITGYFMCKSQITAKKFCKLLFEFEFYNIIIYLIFLITKIETFSIKGFLFTIIPITSINDNFTPCFLVFYLAIPFLNILIKNLNERQHIALIGLLSFVYIFMSTVPKIWVNMNYFSWFIVLYFIASYIRLYPKKIFDSVKITGVLSLVSLVLSILSVPLALKFIPGNPHYLLSDSNKILAVTNGITWFCFFKNIKIKPSKIINLFGGATFGVLCIHANSDTMRQWLWRDLLNNISAYESGRIYWHIFASVFGIFFACAIIDILRQKLIEKPFFVWFDKVIDKITDKIFKKTETK